MSFRYGVLLSLHCYSTVKPKDYIYSAACEVWLWILDMMFMWWFYKIITLTSYLKLTIKINEPHYIYTIILTLIMKVLHNSCNTVTRALPGMSTLSPHARGAWASGVHIRQSTRACVTTIKYRIAPNFRGQIFRDFRELHRNHGSFCYENFLTAPLSTSLDTLKSRNND